jgi:hypothetical protein
MYIIARTERQMYLKWENFVEKSFKSKSSSQYSKTTYPLDIHVARDALSMLVFYNPLQLSVFDCLLLQSQVNFSKI